MADTGADVLIDTIADWGVGNFGPPGRRPDSGLAPAAGTHSGPGGNARIFRRRDASPSAIH
jgi:hypothetical protein